MSTFKVLKTFCALFIVMVILTAGFSLVCSLLTATDTMSNLVGLAFMLIPLAVIVTAGIVFLRKEDQE